MGEDLITTTLAHAKHKTLNFEAARKLLREEPDEVAAAYGGTDFEIETEAEDPVPIIEALAESVKMVEEAMLGGHRMLNSFEAAGYVFHITGGGSYGESPSEIFDHFQRIAECPPLHDAIGFSWPEDAKLGSPRVIVRVKSDAVKTDEIEVRVWDEAGAPLSVEYDVAPTMPATCPDHGHLLEHVANYPDAGTSLFMSEQKCPVDGARFEVAHEAQDDTITITRLEQE